MRTRCAQVADGMGAGFTGPFPAGHGWPPLRVTLSQKTSSSCSSLQCPRWNTRTCGLMALLHRFQGADSSRTVPWGQAGGVCQESRFLHPQTHRSTYVLQKLLGFLEFLVRSPITIIQRVILNTTVSFNKQLRHLPSCCHPRPRHRRLAGDSEVSGWQGHSE